MPLGGGRLGFEAAQNDDLVAGAVVVGSGAYLYTKQSRRKRRSDQSRVVASPNVHNVGRWPGTTNCKWSAPKPPKMRVSLLNFQTHCNYLREADDQVKAHLSKLFFYIFEPGVPNNYIAGVVTEAELSSILHGLQITRELRRTIYRGNYPLVKAPGFSVRQTNTELRPRSRFSTVRLHGSSNQLYCLPTGTPVRLYEEFIRALLEQYFLQCGHSDGEIFRSICRYEDTQPALVGDWLVRLSPSKRISLNLLLDEASGRKNTRVTWDELGRPGPITSGEPEIQSCVDINTARTTAASRPSRRLGAGQSESHRPTPT
ncbi:hypothetical protein F4859DRAFT_526117 [Xylaria cf. heliscus]|nr:hypothetical protein F4859DRAFT_526117 [Xylaria cf. heliscus]